VPLANCAGTEGLVIAGIPEETAQVFHQEWTVAQSVHAGFARVIEADRGLRGPSI
jgi:hypothetical protein